MNSSPRISSQRSQMIQAVLLSVYSLALFGMHFIRIFDNSFWGDESYTIQLVKMNFFRMCFTTAKDVHPPLYYFFTQILYHIFGNHGYTYHLSALIPYGIILVLACTVVRKWFGMIPALRLRCARDVGAEKDIGTSQNDKKSKQIHLIISYSGKR